MVDTELEVVVGGRVVRVAPERVVNAGYSGRDEEAVREHVAELREEGVSAPERVPETYPVGTHTLCSDPGSIGVVGADTSGEAEVAFLIGSRETYVVAASDHTDRALEASDVGKSKAICPNVLSHHAWRLADVREHWDDLCLRAWNTIDGERRRYQDATLGDLQPPEALFELTEERYDGPMAGTVLLSGTVPVIGEGGVAPGSRFAVELYDPERDRSLTVSYDVEVL